MTAFRRPARFLVEAFVAVQEALEEIAEGFLQGLGVLLALAIIAIPFLTVAVLVKVLVA